MQGGAALPRGLLELEEAKLRPQRRAERRRLRLEDATQRPLVIMSETHEGKVEIALTPGHDERLQTYQGFVSLVCELVRHIAGAFDVPEEKVFASVERERVVALRREGQLVAHEAPSLTDAIKAYIDERM